MDSLRNLTVLVVALVSASVAQADEPIVIDWTARSGWRNIDDDGQFNDGRLSNDSVWFLLRGGAESEFRMAFEFDLATVSALPLQNVTLSFDSYNVHGKEATVELHGFFGDGSASRSDVLIDNILDTFIVLGPYASVATWEFDVSALVEQAIALNHGYIGFNLRISNDLILTEGNFGVGIFAPLPDPQWSHLRGPQLLVTLGPEPVAIDIKPGSCPNSLNYKSKGVLPVALLGAVDFDVTEIDPATVRLAGVAPLRWDFEDVATPYEPFTGKQDCTVDCTEMGPDGYMDATLKFDTQEVIAALGEAVQDGACIVAQLTGNLRESVGGTEIVGEDVIRINCKGN